MNGVTSDAGFESKTTYCSPDPRGIHSEIQSRKSYSLSRYVFRFFYYCARLTSVIKIKLFPTFITLIVSTKRNNEIACRFLCYNICFFFILADLSTNIEHHNFATVWKNAFFLWNDSRLLPNGANPIAHTSIVTPQRTRSTYLIAVPNLIYFLHGAKHKINALS